MGFDRFQRDAEHIRNRIVLEATGHLGHHLEFPGGEIFDKLEPFFGFLGGRRQASHRLGVINLAFSDGLQRRDQIAMATAEG